MYPFNAISCKHYLQSSPKYWCECKLLYGYLIFPFIRHFSLKTPEMHVLWCQYASNLFGGFTFCLDRLQTDLRRPSSWLETPNPAFLPHPFPEILPRRPTSSSYCLGRLLPEDP